MKKRDVSALIDEFVSNAAIQGQALCEGDYRRGNKAARRLLALGKMMEKEQETARQMLDVLLKHENVSVRSWASGTALDLGYRTDDAVNALRKISAMPEAGILGLDAEMMLKARHLL